MPFPGPWVQLDDQTYGPLLDDGTDNPDPNQGFDNFQVAASSASAYNTSGSSATAGDELSNTYIDGDPEPNWETFWDDATGGTGNVGPTITDKDFGDAPFLLEEYQLGIHTVHTFPAPRSVRIDISTQAWFYLLTLVADPNGNYVVPDDAWPAGAVDWEQDPDDFGDVLEAWLVIGQWYGQTGNVAASLVPLTDVDYDGFIYRLPGWLTSFGTTLLSYASSSPMDPGGSTTPELHGPVGFDLGDLNDDGNGEGRKVAPLALVPTSVRDSAVQDLGALNDFWTYWQTHNTDPTHVHDLADGFYESAEISGQQIVAAPVLCYRYRPPRIRFLFNRVTQPPLRQRNRNKVAQRQRIARQTSLRQRVTR